MECVKKNMLKRWETNYAKVRERENVDWIVLDWLVGLMSNETSGRRGGRRRHRVIL